MKSTSYVYQILIIAEFSRQIFENLSQNFHFALIHLTLQGDTLNPFLPVIGRKKKLFYLAGKGK